MKPSPRLTETIYEIKSPIQDPFGNIVGEHAITMSIGWEAGHAVEISFVGRGKIGQGVDLLLQDMGIAVSRAIQGRDPRTGEELEQD